jgi:hypothetical protein
MTYDIYTRRDGSFLVLPGVRATNREVEALHGPLQFCETVDAAAHPLPGLWERVDAEIEQHAFAVLQAVVGRQLLDLHCHAARASA